MEASKIVYYSQCDTGRTTLALRSFHFLPGKTLTELFDAVRTSDSAEEFCEKMKSVVQETFALDKDAEKKIKFNVYDDCDTLKYFYIGKSKTAKI